MRSHRCNLRKFRRVLPHFPVELVRKQRKALLISRDGAAFLIVAEVIEFLGVRHWQRLQQNSVNQSKNRCVRADAKRQRQDRNAGESRRLPQRAQPVANILDKCLQQRQRVHLATPFFDLCHSSEPHARRSPCFVGRHAAPQVFLRQEIQMRLQLLRELFIRRAPPQPSPNPRSDQPKPAQHNLHLNFSSPHLPTY